MAEYDQMVTWRPSPLVLGVLFQVMHAGAPSSRTQPVDEALQLLLAHGLVCRVSDDRVRVAEVTPRGYAFIDMLTKVPLPVQAWVDPREVR